MGLILVLVMHASTICFTLTQTYDAYTHIFFADHYAENWFDNWDYRWYTGFEIISYPPLVHQMVALISFIFGLKLAFYIWSIFIVLLLVRGMYYFSRLWVSKEAASIASIVIIFTGSVTEVVHIFGQIPNLTGLAFLLNACPEIYKWIISRSRENLYLSVALLSVVAAAHHVTVIFGMVFFIFPTISVALIDLCSTEKGSLAKVTFIDFVKKTWSNSFRLFSFGIAIGIITFIIILPYWLWTGYDPISQVSIPHGSRNSYLSEPMLGIVFFIIPWGIMLLTIPYIFYRVFSKRNIVLGISFTILAILGTGGTTDLPRLILGDHAFEILTLDRFTFWATVIAVPFFSELLYELYKGEFLRGYLKNYLRKGILVSFVLGLILFNLLIVNAFYLHDFQPKKIDHEPIVNFLNRDLHSNWRFSTLGFGDQMAWLSTNTNALSVDGNYHSARRIPEMTSKAVERLENAKYQGEEGIGVLKEFLSVPEKFNLKFIFSNDKFYEPLLYFSGWNKIQQLENNVRVWEKPDIQPLSPNLPRKNIPLYQRFMWGVLPLASFLIACFLFIRKYFNSKLNTENNKFNNKNTLKLYPTKIKRIVLPQFAWFLFIVVTFSSAGWAMLDNSNDKVSVENVLDNYYNALDYKYFEEAYEYLDPESRPSLDEFLLQISLKDGVSNSYANLDSIYILEKTFLSEDRVRLKFIVESITSLGKYQSKESLEFIKRNSIWSILPKPVDKSVAADQFYSLPSLSFHSQGRRVANSKITRREDVLDRPEAIIIQASLVEKGNSFSIIGEIQNIDNVPAHITVEGILIGEAHKTLSKYNASDVCIHNLLPGARSPFKIDFEHISKENFLKMYKNETQDSYKNEFCETPINFQVSLRTLVSEQIRYKDFGVKDINCMGNKLRASLINTGTEEINIPQIILAEYDSEGVLNWVDSQYLEKGIRAQKESNFFMMYEADKVRHHLKASEASLFVNGVPQSELNYFEDLNRHIKLSGNTSISKNGTGSFKIFVNCFIYDEKE